MNNDFYDSVYNKNLPFEFAHHVGIEAIQKGNRLIFKRCPYCKPTDRDTFSIDIDTGQFICFRSKCGVRGNMFTLSKDFGFKISDEADAYLNRDFTNSKFKKINIPEKIEPKDRAIKYLTGRGISEEIIRKYEVTVSEDEKTRGLLYFPFRDPRGTCWFVKYRNMDFVKGSGMRKEFCSTASKPILFGMYQCEDFTRLVITEGQCDSLACATAGLKNAVSVPMGANNSKWIPHCFEWVSKFEEIVVFGDCEKGGITLVGMITSHFRKKKILVVREADYQGQKDANDLLRAKGKQAVINAVNNAEPIINSVMIDASKIEYVDVELTPKIKTGFESLDKILSGGFGYGTVVLLTGRSGEGKSTVASQFVVEALAQDLNCLIYSGELSPLTIKAVVSGQLYGNKKMTNSQIDECNQFLKDRLYIYNTDAYEAYSEELMSVIIDTVIKRDIKMVLLDNLMMLVTATENDSYLRKQSEFVGKLTRYAKQLNCTFILVAHPRKSYGTLSNNDISGSADIVNRVDTVMSYSRDKDREIEELRIIEVTKNRLTGKLGKFDTWYSENSRRISEDQHNFARTYFETKEDHLEEIPW